jgi:phosphatidylserine/phosphatidylglycerophosphate/cardiolipin synthase-like enzyme
MTLVTEGVWRSPKFIFSVFFVGLSLIGAVGYAGVHSNSFKSEKDGVELLLNDAYVSRVLELISSSKKRVWVSMYVAKYQKKRSYSIENKLFKALAKAHARGVDVRVLLDEGMEWDGKSGRMSNRRSSKNDDAIDYLLEQGLSVRLDSPEQIMHAKTLVVDSGFAVIGSHNWTYSALSRNIETSVLLSREHDVAPLAKVFQDQWSLGHEPD